MRSASLPESADALPVDPDTIRATIGRALIEGPAPRYATLEELEGLLRGHVQLLLPEAQEAGAPRNLLASVRVHLKEGMGEGLVSARVHVRQLAHDARALLRHVEAGR
ncbi:DUF6415 family natural product biosynthesis protein [Streptomyces sp. DSM 42041]|uniref:DUF6415 family natural product biosynthesis protein n=1 Tax=Streptomyces hazeniae TaxID=3075538 RepID=A0ABU2NLC5_9ACTN|nr:DUF6415 family natural product biosynthesis protein [Streptomyces sp. DSM 42041]MDT0377560.1 DUF6415 family natural product biosynthesis protein [Streptomyces sp. DSM 42041]